MTAVVDGGGGLEMKRLMGMRQGGTSHNTNKKQRHRTKPRERVPGRELCTAVDMCALDVYSSGEPLQLFFWKDSPVLIQRLNHNHTHENTHKWTVTEG